MRDALRSIVANSQFRPLPASFVPVDENLTAEAVVVVIEDDASVRAALKELIESVGLKVRLYASAGAFLEAHIPDATSCLVLDVRLPEMSGIKIQEDLSRAGVHVPIVFVTGYADVAMAVRAMKAGAVDFLTKPFRSQDLLDAVFAALERDSARRKMQQWQSMLREYYESLSARERQVITRVTAGKLNKQIAADLGLSEVTVKVHRASAMRKMRATSLAHLVKMLEHCDPAISARSPNSVTASTPQSTFRREEEGRDDFDPLVVNWPQVGAQVTNGRLRFKHP